MLQINGKTFMNLQEAVQWLLDNNAIPFQSSANYIANTEIGLGTLVNPSPAKVRIGSLIFFADSKVSTVTGLTENGFIVSDQYNDLVDDVVYVSNVQLDASNHLIVTLSNGDTIDAGQIKEVTNFSIDASQHLIANYNDGTSTDLGAIFSGNVSITGTMSAGGGVSTPSLYVSGNASIVGNATVTGNVQASADLNVGGNATISGALLGDNIKKYYDATVNSAWLNGCTLENSFVKAFLNCGELQFIANFRITNATGSSITLPNDSQMTSAFPIPSSLKQKIYAHNGNTCESGSQGSIAMATLYITETSGGVNADNNPKYANLYSSSSSIFLYNEGGQITVPANKTLDFEVRISLAL